MIPTVRPALYDTDANELVEVLQRNIPQRPHAKFFRWLYLENPEGTALTWVATDPGSNRIVGVAAAFPRRIYFHDEELPGYVLGDFAIDASHRSLGVAVTLQRSCLAGLSAAKAGFILDFPSRTMLAIYKRLQIPVSASMIRYAKPLRADRKVAERVPVQVVARGLSAIANAGLRLRDGDGTSCEEYTIAEECAPWNEEFTTATRKWSASAGTCVARTATYLNWRYGAHPEQQYKMLTARGAQGLAGYLLYHTDEEDGTVDDLFAQNDSVRNSLLTELSIRSRKRRLHTVSIPWLSTHPGTALLESCNFRPRDSSPVVLLTVGQNSGEPKGIETSGWYLSHGDWEA